MPAARPPRRVRPWISSCLLAVAALVLPAQNVGAKGEAAGEVVGFSVEISGGGSDVDSAWETCSGGGVMVVDPTAGALAVEPLTLQGPVTAERKNLGAPPDEFLENGAGSWRVEIEGSPEASAATQSVSVEDLAIDMRETSTGTGGDYRVYAPGDVHYGSATIHCQVGKGRKELYDWWQDASRGKNIRKSISVICLKRDGSPARTFNLHDCFPTAYRPFEFSAARGACETLTVKIGRIEFVTRGGRKNLCQWINDTVNGRPWKQSVTVTEITKNGAAGKSYNYLDCFPVRYAFPAFDASSSGPLIETVTVKPIRVELK